MDFLEPIKVFWWRTNSLMHQITESLLETFLPSAAYLIYSSSLFFLHGSRTILLKKKEERQSGIVTLYNLLWLNACDTVFIWYSSLEMPLLCYMSYSFFISSHRKLKGRFAKDAIFSSVTLTLFDITTELD